MDDDDAEVLVSRLQRELGLVAARAEDGRRRAEEALEVERTKNAALARSAQEAAEEVTSLRAETADLRRQLAETQEAPEQVTSLRAEAADLRRQLAEVSPEQITSLRAEAADLRRQLAEAQDTTGQVTALQAELARVRQDLLQAQDARGQATALQAELAEVRQELRQALDATGQATTLQAELARVQQDLLQAQDATGQATALRTELARVRRELLQAQEAAASAAAQPASSSQSPETLALREEVARLRRELSEAQAAIAASHAVASTATSADAEAARMRRELRGMSVVVSTLEKKLGIYEQRLLEQATTCAEEINDLKCRLSSVLGSNAGSPGGRADDGYNQADYEDDLSDLRIHSVSSSLGNFGHIGLGGLGLSPSSGPGGNSLLPWSADGGGDGYYRMGTDDESGDRNARGGGSSLLSGMAKWPSALSMPATVGFNAGTVGFFGNSAPYNAVPFTNSSPEPQVPGGYQPPKLPDAI